jgi:hypothetical protein
VKKSLLALALLAACATAFAAAAQPPSDVVIASAKVASDSGFVTGSLAPIGLQLRGSSVFAKVSTGGLARDSPGSITTMQDR